MVSGWARTDATVTSRRGDLWSRLDDVEHAADARALCAERLDGAEEDALVAEAERVLRANWTLLDGVERLCAD
jgi:hypothetical protein